MSSAEVESVNDSEVAHCADSKGKDGSSGIGSAEEATQTLLVMQRQAVETRDRERKRAEVGRTSEPSPKKQYVLGFIHYFET